MIIYMEMRHKLAGWKQYRKKPHELI